MAPTRIPKKVFLSEMKNGKRDTGRPKLRYKDTLKATLKHCEIGVDEIDRQNVDLNPLWEAKERRNHWRSTINKGVEIFERCRIDHKKKKRLLRKQREQNKHHDAQSTISLPDAVVRCDVCNQTCKNLSGLKTHKSRKHK